MEVFGGTMGTQEWKSLFFFLFCKWRISFHKVSNSTYLFHKKVTNIANFLAGDERAGTRKGNLFFTLSAVARSPRVRLGFLQSFLLQVWFLYRLLVDLLHSESFRQFRWSAPWEEGNAQGTNVCPEKLNSCHANPQLVAMFVVPL